MTAPGGLPYPVKVEIEWVPGAWTDVTAEVDSETDSVLTSGRTSPLAQPGPAEANVTFRNLTGIFTPGRQVLTDGTPAPYYPNVRVRRRLRVSVTIASVVYTRFLGPIVSYTPVITAGNVTGMTVVANDGLDALDRVKMGPPLRDEIMFDNPAAYWPLNDPTPIKGTDQTGSEQSGSNAGVPAMSVYYGGGTTVSPTWGAVGPGFGEGTAVTFGGPTNRPLTTTGNTRLTGTPPRTIEFCFATTQTTVFTLLGIGTDGLAPLATFNVTTGQLQYNDAGGGGTFAPTVNDGLWHHVAATRSSATGNVNVYLDGVSVGAVSTVTPWTFSIVQVGGAYGASPSTMTGSVAQIAFNAGQLPAARIAARRSAILGWQGERIDARCARFLALAGVTSANYSLDSSPQTVDTYPQDGATVLGGLQDMATTEGGGAAVYMSAGVVRYANKDVRQGNTPSLILDAEADLIGDSFTPSTDDLSLINSSTVTRASQVGTNSVLTATSPASINEFGLLDAGGAITSYGMSDLGATLLAQWIVAENAQPGLRVPKLAVDLVNAATDRWVQAFSTNIGSRIRLTNLPAKVAASTQVEVIAEGVTETFSTGSYVCAWDASPADSPAYAIFDHAPPSSPSLGRFQADGQTLSGAITASATTIVVASPAGKPTFTTAAGQYPMTVQIGAEVMALGSAPATATSPQTFTGVTRGYSGTSASAQSSGAAVNVWPLATYAL